VYGIVVILKYLYSKIFTCSGELKSSVKKQYLGMGRSQGIEAAVWRKETFVSENY
jgi:hypothetical protein